MPDRPAQQRWSLVTGCSGPDGLGSHIARALLAEGYGVFATSRRMETLIGLEAEGCHALVLDVASAGSIRDAVQEVSNITGGVLHSLVNTAGLFGRGLILDSDLDKIRRIFEVNVFGTLAVSQAFAPLLVQGAHHAGKMRRTSIVNLGSISDFGTPHIAGYSASKAALKACSYAMRGEMAGFGVDVIFVLLGNVDTGFCSNDKVLDTRLTSLDPKQTPPLVSDAGSLYANSRDDIWTAEKRSVSRDFKASPYTAEGVAKEIVETVKREGPLVLYTGYQSWTYRWILPWVPTWAMDWLLASQFALGSIRPSESILKRA